LADLGQTRSWRILEKFQAKLAVGVFWKTVADLSQTCSGVFEEEPEAIVGEQTRRVYLLRVEARENS
jgi:hypothetical protein